MLNCGNCTHCTNKYCQVFKRPVDVSINVCRNHSNFKPDAKAFKANKNLEIIIKAEEKARAKAYKGYLKEEEFMRKQILKEIEKEKQQRKTA